MAREPSFTKRPVRDSERVLCVLRNTLTKDGQVVPDGPVDWPEGCRLRIEPDAVQPGASMQGEDDWSNLPEAIADWLAWYDSLEPLVFTVEEAADGSDQSPHVMTRLVPQRRGLGRGFTAGYQSRMIE